MRRMGAMTTAMIAALCCVGMAASAATKGDGFEGLVRAVNARYHVHETRVPMMWAVSLVARGVTHNGIRGMRVVTYEAFPADADRTEIETMVRSELGAGWSPMVRSVRPGSAASKGETSLVYVEPNGDQVRMVVVSLEGRELSLVRMEMNPEALARWQKDER